MSTKRKPAPTFGSRVTGVVGGRATPDMLRMIEIADRVNLIRKRLRLTWPVFQTRIGMTEKTRRHRMSAREPVPFTADELTTICRVCGVSADYLLLGIEPALQSERRDGADLPLPVAIHRHLTAVAGTRLEMDPLTVVSVLPDAEGLLSALEDATAEAARINFEKKVANAKDVMAALRLAAAAHTAKAWSPDQPAPAFVESAVAGLRERTILDLPRQGALARPPSDTDRERESLGSAGACAKPPTIR